MTQRTLADRLGVTEQQVQRWEATAYARRRLTVSAQIVLRR